MKATHPAMENRMRTMSETVEHWTTWTSYKGHAGVVDNLKKYNGYFLRGTSSGSIWVGATLRPLKRFENNFQVVSTDYYNYAIVYQCTFETAMYNQDNITILTRQSPALEPIDDKVMEEIRSEFDRIFGTGLENNSERPKKTR